MFVTHFNVINDWTVEDHNVAHHSDLTLLNDTVRKIEREDAQREIMVFTHHSPTILDVASDQAHKESEVSSAFVTDLSMERWWMSPLMKVSAWGHAHFNCDFRDPKTGKRCIVNQEEYGISEKFEFDRSTVVSISGTIPLPTTKENRKQPKALIPPITRETTNQPKSKS